MGGLVGPEEVVGSLADGTAGVEEMAISVEVCRVECVVTSLVEDLVLDAVCEVDVGVNDVIGLSVSALLVRDFVFVKR